MTATTTYPKSAQWRSGTGPAGDAEHSSPPALIAGDDVDAISMPASFGALVLAELEIMMLAGPIVADDDGSWTFLTQRVDPRQPAVPADLLPLGVRAVLAGTPLATADPAGRPPVSWWTVIGAARRVAHRTRRVA